MLDRILARVDDSTEGVRALRLAIELAREIGADLKVIIVLKPLPACFSFAMSAVFADIWRQAQPQKVQCASKPGEAADGEEPGYMRMSSWSPAMKYRRS